MKKWILLDLGDGIREEFYFSVTLNIIYAMPTSTIKILPKMLVVNSGFENFALRTEKIYIYLFLFNKKYFQSPI